MAAHTARLDPLIRGREFNNDGRWPWAASAMARESVLYFNDHRHGGAPIEHEFAGLYNCFTGVSAGRAASTSSR